jgi:hypothetical protein
MSTPTSVSTSTPMSISTPVSTSTRVNINTCVKINTCVRKSEIKASNNLYFTTTVFIIGNNPPIIMYLVVSLVWSYYRRHVHQIEEIWSYAEINLVVWYVVTPDGVHLTIVEPHSGSDPGFQVRGAHLKKLRRAEAGAKFFGVFRVKNFLIDKVLNNYTWWQYCISIHLILAICVVYFDKRSYMHEKKTIRQHSNL